MCKDGDHLAVWVYLLLNATHKEYPSVFKGQKVVLKPGQLITGRKSISKELRVHESKVQRILTCFENEQQIEQLRGNNNRLVSILSWDEYQTSEQLIEHEMNIKRTTDEQLMNTNKNVKNDKNERRKGVRDEKQAYADTVLLTPKQYETLLKKHGVEKTKAIIDKLNDYKIGTGKSYDSDYMAITRWVVKSVEENNQIKNSNVIKGQFQQSKPVDKVIEARNIEIARNRWIEGGNNPSEFRYEPASSS